MTPRQSASQVACFILAFLAGVVGIDRMNHVLHVFEIDKGKLTPEGGQVVAWALPLSLGCLLLSLILVLAAIFSARRDAGRKKSERN